MKPLLIALAAAAAILLLIPGAALSSARAGGSAPATSARVMGCPPLRHLPPATAAGQTVLYGHIRTLKRAGTRFALRFDPALWLTGSAANRAAGEDGREVANDYYILDESRRLLTYLVPGTADVSVVGGLPGRGPCGGRRTVAELARLVQGRYRFGFWIRIGEKYPGLVLSLDEQYQP